MKPFPTFQVGRRFPGLCPAAEAGSSVITESLTRQKAPGGGHRVRLVLFLCSWLRLWQERAQACTVLNIKGGIRGSGSRPPAVGGPVHVRVPPHWGSGAEVLSVLGLHHSPWLVGARQLLQSLAQKGRAPPLPVLRVCQPVTCTWVCQPVTCTWCACVQGGGRELLVSRGRSSEPPASSS